MIPIKQAVIMPDGSRVEISRRAIAAPESSLTGCSPRRWKSILKRAWDAAGQYWHRVILPKKFTHAGATEYNYQPREQGYEAQKRKKFGHTYPLVWSGELERLARRLMDVRSDSKGARIVIHGPRYLFAYRKNIRQPDKAEELRRVSEADAAAVARVINQVVADESNRRPGAGHRGVGGTGALSLDQANAYFGGSEAAG